MLGRLTRTFGRLVGLTFTILGFWVLIVNVVEQAYAGWVLVWIIGAGLAGTAGGMLYLLSFDGPSRFRNRAARLIGWGGMLFLSVLPTSVTLVLFPLVLLAIPTLFLREDKGSPSVESTA